MKVYSKRYDLAHHHNYFFYIVKNLKNVNVKKKKTILICVDGGKGKKT